MATQSAAVDLWEQIFGSGRGLLHIFSGERDGNKLTKTNECNFNYPNARETAAAWAIEESNKGREAYFAAHLLTAPQRVKENAAEVCALWCDLDGCAVPNGELSPGVVVESSPGMFHAYWVLTDPIPPEIAESLNRRLAHEIGADATGFDLSQLLRVPGTQNNKYEARPVVSLLEVSDVTYSPRELDELLPKIEEPQAGHEPEEDGEEEPPVLLSGKNLEIWHGKHPKLTEDGDVDRSSTLLKIGRVLYDAGAQRRVVVAALEERDETLGYRKYSDRKNDRKYYEDIFKELEKNGRNKQARIGSKTQEERFTQFTQIAGSLREPMPFPTEAMPDNCQKLIRDGSTSIGCPPDFIGLPMLVVLGSAIGNSRRVKVKGGWTESASLYGAVIAVSGDKKTPAQTLASAPAFKQQTKLRDEYRKDVEKHKKEMRDWEAKKKNAHKNGDDSPEPPKAPTMERTVVGDATIEAVAKILDENWRGVCVFRDEFISWVKGMDQYKPGGKGTERQFWLSVWSGVQAQFDRKGENESVLIPHPFAGVFGSIQPDILPELHDNRGDGFFERLLHSYPYPTLSEWTDEEISWKAEVSYSNLYHALRDLKPGKNGEGNEEPVLVLFEEDAKELFIELYNQHQRQRKVPGFPKALHTAWPKLEAYIARLCLILAMSRFVVKGGSERITKADVQNAALLVAYFKNHAHRVYAALCGEDPDDVLAFDLVRFLAERGGHFRGQPTELFESFDSRVKPKTAAWLINHIKQVVYKQEGFTQFTQFRLEYTEGHEYIRNPDTKTGKSTRRFVDLRAPLICVNCVNLMGWMRGTPKKTPETSGEGGTLCPPTVVKVRQDKTAPFDEYIGDEDKHRETKEVVYEKSIWANPYNKEYRRGEITLEESLAKYEADIRSCPDLMAKIPDLAGKRLGCWCKPKKCHGDVLVKLFKELCGDEDGDVLWMN